VNEIDDNISSTFTVIAARRGFADRRNGQFCCPTIVGNVSLTRC
jgi:hypothetical protein